ncbi:MAG: hypothetical protein JOZ22_20230, partial [Acidobacteriia bacterium]|nr:hypothetical protein [Terriglobia bacterium]
MPLIDIFRSKAQQRFWAPFPQDHVMGGSAAAPIDKNQAYFILRIKEMYVAYSRRLWRKLYPMLHSFVEHGQSQENAIAGPGQLRELGDSNLDRIVNLNYRLAGPTPFSGEDLSILVGLYSVPGQGAAKALIDTVASVATLGGVALGSAVQIAQTVKSGVESILGLDGSQLALGVRDTINAGQPLRSGYYLAVSAPASDVDFSKLWLTDGRLVHGQDPIAAARSPYQDYDYLVLEVERRDTRDDWPSLPGISEFQDQFAAIMADHQTSVEEKKNRFKELWPRFRAALDTSRLLTVPDREVIAHSVSQDLVSRLDRIKNGNPFETRSWGDSRQRAVSPAEFDFVDVA